MTELAWGSVHKEMSDVLADTPADVPGVVAVLTQLQELLCRATPDDADNPIADFNDLYRIITEAILDRLERGAFADPEFLTLLDVEFAGRYFDALRRWGRDRADAPEAWKVLFCRLRDGGLPALPAAAAGVNAHINYDLPFALVRTWEKLGSSPDDERQHGDYLLINEVFFENIPTLRRGYLATWQLFIDRLNGRIDDWYQNALVELARNLAWHEACRIWPLRNDAEALRQAEVSLDRHAAVVGWMLLSPAGHFLQ